jgi:hypothetical protein
LLASKVPREASARSSLSIGAAGINSGQAARGSPRRLSVEVSQVIRGAAGWISLRACRTAARRVTGVRAPHRRSTRGRLR